MSVAYSDMVAVHDGSLSSWVSINILLIEGVLLTMVLLVDPEGLAGRSDLCVTLTSGRTCSGLAVELGRSAAESPYTSRMISFMRARYNAANTWCWRLAVKTK